MLYLGKRIEVKVPQRDNQGKLNGKFTTAAGICELEPQKNEILGIPLQTVINRMPVSLQNLESVRIID